jgi:hypothetical protein
LYKEAQLSKGFRSIKINFESGKTLVILFMECMCFGVFSTKTVFPSSWVKVNHSIATALLVYNPLLGAKLLVSFGKARISGWFPNFAVTNVVPLCPHPVTKHVETSVYKGLMSGAVRLFTKLIKWILK